MKDLQVIQTLANSVYQGNSTWARRAIVKNGSQHFIGWQIEDKDGIVAVEKEGVCLSLEEAQDLLYII
ncbi:MAG: hypothetical protein ACRC4W_05310 [Treponemataceae bacterium]